MCCLSFTYMSFRVFKQQYGTSQTGAPQNLEINVSIFGCSTRVSKLEQRRYIRKRNKDKHLGCGEKN